MRQGPEQRPSEVEPATRGPERVRALSRGKNFPAEAVALLEAEGVEPVWGRVYMLSPSTPIYRTFLHTLLMELEGLPFDDKVGKTILMRRDAKEVAEKLTGYVQKRFDEVTRTGVWSAEEISELTDIFEGLLEVFKNEIYPEHHIDGIGYNVDLTAALTRAGARSPAEIVLERRYVTTDDGFSVTENGKFKLNLRTGGLTLEFDEYATPNVHTGQRS